MSAKLTAMDVLAKGINFRRFQAAPVESEVTSGNHKKSEVLAINQRMRIWVRRSFAQLEGRIRQQVNWKAGEWTNHRSAWHCPPAVRLSRLLQRKPGHFKSELLMGRLAIESSLACLLQ
mmetsp:Transcript_154038/g.266792  ORF Transcript_154038/g.266792 Transcript_154038/m.266792 type:complete len:119 (+) Transcript_154038:882-1238(+)